MIAEEAMKRAIIFNDAAIDAIKEGKYNLQHIWSYCAFNIDVLNWSIRTQIVRIKNGTS